jgi:hypothetical protein
MPQPITPTPPRPPTQINARAAELKAQLLKGREARASSSTPPVGIPGLVAKQTTPADGSNSLRGSPKTPLATPGDREQERSINELILQCSGSMPATKSSVEQEKNTSDPKVSTSQRILKLPEPPAKSQAPSLGSPTRVLKPVSNGKHTVNNTTAKNFQRRPTSNGSISEGEILEEPTTQKVLPPTEPKEPQTSMKPVDIDDQASRELRNSDNLKHSQEESPPRRAVPSNPKSQTSRPRDGREGAESRTDKRRHESDYGSERKAYPESDNRAPPRRDPRDQDEEYRGAEIKNEQKREINRPNAPAREQKLPTLAQILSHDDDLREWLDITGYHNAAYRDKILNRRRAIAALDAQREKLLAEMEAEERVPVAGNHTPTTAMLPPPIPNKVGSRAEPTQKLDRGIAEPQRGQVVSNKRPYSDVQDTRVEDSGGKVARTDDRGHRVQIKEEEDIEPRGPRPSGFDPSRRSSIDHHDERDSPRSRYNDGRGRGRASGREREISPGPRAYESRAPARRAYEPAADDYHDRDERQDRASRPFEVHGTYRGRAYDPSYRGRGRGRGRSDFQSHLDQKPESSFGTKIANSKLWKDPKGFERGGKGGQ